MESVPTQEAGHTVLFPFAAVGHINPMLHLASSLCSGYGIKVTFLITEYRLSHMEKETKKKHEDNTLFSFYAFPDSLSSAAEDHEGPMAVIKLFLAMGEMAGSSVFESVMQDLQSRGPPVSCIISDTFLSGTQFVAEKLGIPRVAFWTSCASSYLIHHYAPLLIAQGHLPLSESKFDQKKMLELPGLCPLPTDKLPIVMQATDTSDIGFNAFLHLFENDQKCVKLIINSYIDLEPEQFKLLENDFSSVIGVGPLLPSDLLLKEPSFQGFNNRMQVSKENQRCLQWLDSKPASSVLYVSFGSIASLEKEELHELALGLESSKTNFLWVIRGFNARDDGGLPNGFLERTKEHCLIVDWVPQLQVLAHFSVGGFLTHCGWNSTIESMSLGVPLIAMPTDFGEQKMIGWLIEHMWKIGLQLKLNMKSSLCQHEVGVAVRALMEGEEGAVYRINAQKLSDAAKKAIIPGGSSHDGLRLLVET